MPVWNFYNFFILKESLAFMFDMVHLHDDTLHEYDELEVRTFCYLKTVPSDGLRVGQLVAVNWRMERWKDSDDKIVPQSDEVLYEVDANSENWMIAGRKRGHVALSTKQGSTIVISILCVPFVGGRLCATTASLAAKYR